MIEDEVQPATFVKRLADTLGFVERRSPERLPGFDLYYLDLTSLKLSLGRFVPFLCPTASVVVALNREELSKMVADASALQKSYDIKVLVVGSNVGDLGGHSLRELYAQRTALLDGSAVATMLGQQDLRTQQRHFVAELVRFLGREALSPYSSGRLASDGRFFGRKGILERMVGGESNIAVVGARRIGKSSLLAEIRSRIRFNRDSIRICAQYGSKFGSSREVLEAILLDLGVPSSRISDLDTRALKLQFSQLLKQFAPCWVFIDEVDHILEWDKAQGFELFEIFRDAFSSIDGCRIFLAGFRQLISMLNDSSSPLFNFVWSVPLGPLTTSEVREMVELPLELLGIDVISLGIHKAIYEVTGGQPELVQLCCSEVLTHFSEHNTLPKPEDFKSELRLSIRFQQHVVGSFLANSNDIERLLACLLAREAQGSARTQLPFRFSVPEASALLKSGQMDLGIGKLHHLFTTWGLLGMIRRVPGQEVYEFAVPFLMEYLSEMPIESVMRRVAPSTNADADPVHPSVELIAAERDVQSPTEPARAVEEKFALFVSYNRRDLEWASWIAWVLEEAGHSVTFQAWDFTVGTNFVRRMHDALTTTDKLVLVLSEEYLASSFTSSEWNAVFRLDPVGLERKLIPIRVRPCAPEGLLGPIVYLDLVGRSEAEAYKLVVSALHSRNKPDARPKFPLIAELEIGAQNNPRHPPYPSGGSGSSSQRP
jgi:hypothetical protein